VAEGHRHTKGRRIQSGAIRLVEHGSAAPPVMGVMGELGHDTLRRSPDRLRDSVRLDQGCAAGSADLSERKPEVES